MNLKNKIIAISIIMLFISSITLAIATAEDINYSTLNNTYNNSIFNHSYNDSIFNYTQNHRQMQEYTSEDIIYSISEAIIDIRVESNGLLHIEENIHYSFDSSANGVYRTIPLKNGESIDNIEIETQGAYCDYTVEKTHNEEKIRIYLYSDSEKLEKIAAGDDVEVNINYDFKNVTNIYSDTGELQYKVWGDEWDKNPEKLSVYIHFPSKNGINYWINPYKSNTEENWDKNTLILKNNEVKDYIEIRATIPLSEFTSYEYANVKNCPGLEDINKIQNSYEFKESLLYNLPLIIFALFVLSLTIPITIYLKFGREPKIDYDGIYEIEPPTEDSPAFVNAMMDNFNSNVGELNINGFQATILDLINRKYILIDLENDGEDNRNAQNKDEENKNTSKDLKNNKDKILKINKKGLNKLKPFEKEVIDILKTFEVEGKINLKDMQNKLKEKSSAHRFISSLNNWSENFKAENLKKEILEKYLNFKGFEYIKTYGNALIIISTIMIAVGCILNLENWIEILIIIVLFAITGGIPLKTPANFFKEENGIYKNTLIKLIGTLIIIALIVILAFFLDLKYKMFIFVGAIMFISGCIILILPITIFSRWTKEGMEYHKKWNNFKKYLTDYSLIKEYPPQSIAIWNKYLIYATALGIADEVYETMKFELRNEIDYSDALFIFFNSGNYRQLNLAFIYGFNTVRNSDILESIGRIGGGSGRGRIGGPGGGSGGGGGGAF